MKKLLSFSTLVMLMLLFTTGTNGYSTQVDHKTVIIPGCFSNSEVTVEIDYNTSTSDIIGVTVTQNASPYNNYSVISYEYSSVSYSGGVISVTGFRVDYTIPGVGNSYAVYSGDLGDCF